MAEPIEIPFGCGLLWADGSMCYMGAHWSHLANTIELSVCGGDAALCQIRPTLTICLQFWFSDLYCNHALLEAEAIDFVLRILKLEAGSIKSSQRPSPLSLSEAPCHETKGPFTRAFSL